MLQDTVTSVTDTASLIRPLVSKNANTIETLSLQSDDENSLSVYSSRNYKRPDLTLPIIKQTLTTDDIIKQEFILCTRIEEWYNASAKNVDVELRKKKYRWRQFKAVLTKNKLELYHITSAKIRRLAHTIELNSKYGNAKLSILSPIDYIWGLSYLDPKKRKQITFHFQSAHLSDAQDWYMTLYQLLALSKTKNIGNIIPPFVDLVIPEIDHFVIRIPLHTLSDYQLSCTAIYNIRMHHLKSVVLQILEYRAIKPSHWSAENVSLCWTLDSHTEWVTDKQNTLLVGPQLVEQRHRLELRCLSSRDQRISLLEESCFDGLLKPWQWNNEEKIAVDQGHDEVYAILVGHFLFLVDNFHYYNRSGKERKAKKSWFSSTNGLLQKKNRISVTSAMEKKGIRHSVQSAPTPQFVISAPETEPRRVFPLMYAKKILDLSKIELVDVIHNSTNSNNNLFKICLKDSYTLCYEADTIQTMMEWTRILVNQQQQQKVDEYHSQSSVMLKAESTMWHQFCRNHQIVKSGILYVKTKRLFYRKLCILTNGNGFLLYDTFKSKKWNSQSTTMLFYNQYYRFKLDNNTYIYSGSECITDQQIVKKQDPEPARLFMDGLVTEKMKPSDCYFVIWNRKSKERFTRTRNCISIFKSGHHLGCPGSFWVFKTRNKAEKDHWVWALHQEYGINVL